MSSLATIRFLKHYQSTSKARDEVLDIIVLQGTCAWFRWTGSTETEAKFDVIAETLRLTNLGSLQEGIIGQL